MLVQEGCYFLLGQVEAQCFHGDFELVVVDVVVAVEVEELELSVAINTFLPS